MLTDTQIERGKVRLRLAQEIMRDAVSGLSQKATAERLGVNLNIVSFWARALGVARTRQAGIGAGGSYDRQEIPRGL